MMLRCFLSLKRFGDWVAFSLKPSFKASTHPHTGPLAQVLPVFSVGNTDQKEGGRRPPTPLGSALCAG